MNKKTEEKPVIVKISVSERKELQDKLWGNIGETLKTNEVCSLPTIIDEEE